LKLARVAINSGPVRQPADVSSRPCKRL
jgi:hypothetical protein